MLPLIVHTEYENENEMRAYPFADNATLLDTDGVSLPVDFITDAHIYPIDTLGVPYISEIDCNSRIIYIADSVSGLNIGQAEYSSDVAAGDYVDVVDPDAYDRSVGILVFGSGVASTAVSAQSRSFSAVATMFALSAFTPIMQAGVRGIILPDNTVMTGDIRIQGTDGVWVSSEYIDGVPTLRIDVVGVPEDPDTDDAGVALPPPIKRVKVTRTETSELFTYRFDLTSLGISLPGYSVDEICAAKKKNGDPFTSRADTDVCDDEADVEAAAQAAIAEHLALVQTRLDGLVTDGDLLFYPVRGNLNLVAPSTTDFRNAVSIKATGATVMNSDGSYGTTKYVPTGTDTKLNLMPEVSSNLVSDTSDGGETITISIIGASA